MWKTINDIIKNKNKSFTAPTKLVNTNGQNTLTNPQRISKLKPLTTTSLTLQNH